VIVLKGTQYVFRRPIMTRQSRRDSSEAATYKVFRPGLFVKNYTVWEGTYVIFTRLNIPVERTNEGTRMAVVFRH
jgi:hypothetical protein